MPDDNGRPFEADAPDLNALIGSRICHDLISPLGAIGNGVELLSISGLGAAPEIALIAESIENANARIRFYRIAFGSVGPDATVGRSEVRSILADLYRGARVRVDWAVPGEAARGEVKIAFLLMQCLEAALPWGGEIAVHATGERWHVTGRAERVKDIPELWDVVSGLGIPAELAAADVHFALAPAAASAAGRRIDILSRTGDRVELSF